MKVRVYAYVDTYVDIDDVESEDEAIDMAWDKIEQEVLLSIATVVLEDDDEEDEE